MASDPMRGYLNAPVEGTFYFGVLRTLSFGPDIVGNIQLGAPDPIPTSLNVTAPLTTLTTTGQTVQLSVIATYQDGSTGNVTAASAGTNYFTSNPTIASVSPDGLVTAQSSGTALISAINEGPIGLIRISIVLSGDSDGDGIPDDVELSLGLDPNNPVDALEDPDGDGLSTAQEIQLEVISKPSGV